MTEEQVTSTTENQTQQVTTPIEENNVVDNVNSKEINSEATSSQNLETKQIDNKTIQDNPEVSKNNQPDTLDKTSDNDIKNNINEEVEFSPDIQVANLQRQIAMINNIGQQEFLKLCNKYGVDFRPENIDASAEELKQRDPNGYVDFNLKLNQLHNDITQRTGELKQNITFYEVNNTLQPYRELLNNSPVTNKVVNDILGQIQYVNPTQQVNYIMNSVMNIYREAFEAGTLYAQTNKEQLNNPETVLNNSVMSNNPSVGNEAPLKRFTREDIAKMSLDDFKKNEKLIDDLLKQGLL